MSNEKPQEFWIYHDGDGKSDVYDCKLEHKIEDIHVIEYSAYEKLGQDKASNDKDYFEMSARLNKEIEELEDKLEKAMKYLKEGKARFAPNTTNSFVDELITDYDDLIARSVKNLEKRLEKK